MALFSGHISLLFHAALSSSPVIEVKRGKGNLAHNWLEKPPSWPFVPINRAFTLPTPWSRSTLLHQRGSALADFLKRHFEATKFLRTQFREHSLHLPGMLSKG